ncbi:hypothetical protein DL95DRAFT_407399 [Leptodontidium sp. 2 PMI_412]|nr:hypothetical protein DL95DRAFT_407399 [Leptodontidium sp. 2 PMI_412]
MNDKSKEAASHPSFGKTDNPRQSQRGAKGEPRARSNIIEKGPAERAEGSIDVSIQDWLEDQERQRLEQERLEQERVEQERLEQEQLEEERVEQERLEQERLDQERQEEERQEEERLDQERLDQERLDQERLEKERKRRTQFNIERVAAALRQAQERQQAQTNDYRGQGTTGLNFQSGQEPELNLQKEARQRQGRRDQGRLKREKSIDSDEHLALAQQHRTTLRARKH